MTITRRRFTALIIFTMLLLTFISGCGKNKEHDEDESKRSTAPSSATVTIATVTSRELNLRSTPSFEGTVLKTLVKGETVEILERKEVEGVSWGKTEKGWICLLYVALEEINTAQPTESPSDTTPPSETSGANTSLIIVEALNIRSGPSAENELLGEYKWGDMVEILEEKNGWARTDKGWINLGYVYCANKPDMAPMQVTVIASTLNIRQGPSVNYASITTLSEGDQTTILKQIKMSDGYWGYNGTGWLYMDYVEPAK